MRKHILLFLTKMIQQHKIIFLSSLLLVILSKMILVYMPIVIGKIIDILNKPIINHQQIYYLVGNFSLLWLCSLVITPLQEFCITKFVQVSILEASVNWIEQIMQKDFSFFNSLNVGNLVSGIDRGILSHEKLLYHVNGDLLSMLLEFFITVYYLKKFTNPYFMLILVFIFFINFFVSHWLIVKRRPQIFRVNTVEDELAGELTDVLSNGIILKLEQSVDFVVKRIRIPFEKYANESITLAVSSAIIEAVKFMIANLIATVTLLFGIWSIMHQQMTTGELIATLSIVNRVSNSFNNFLKSKKIFDQFSVDVNALLEILQQKNFTRAGENIALVDSIELKGYRANRENIPFVFDKHIKVNKGEKVAIVGPTGKGKSTLLNILAGLTASARSRVKINDIALDKYSSTAHLSMIRYCPQKNYLLAGRVGEAVFFDQQFGNEQRRILQSLDLNQEIASNKKILTERATNISGGEAKRLALSRLLNNPGEIMLCDEPTAALNKDVAKKVWNNLFNVAKDKILICTTHDLDYLAEFDQVIYL